MKLTIIIAINCFVSSVKFRNRADKALTEKSSERRALIFIVKKKILKVLVRNLNHKNISSTSFYVFEAKNNDNWGQFHQPYGAKHKCAGRHSLAPFSFTNKNTPNFTSMQN